MLEYRKINKNKYISKYSDSKFIQIEENQIRARGGDGTLLDAIREFRHLGLPFYGEAAGTENFLMNKSKEPKRTKTIKVRMIKVTEIVREKPGKTWQAFNEVYLGELCGWTHFYCFHDDDILGNLTGAGIIISTAQGSTGLNKNNKGVILPIGSKNWSVTSVQATKDLNYVLEPKPIKIMFRSRDKCTKLLIDGKEVLASKDSRLLIEKGDEVEIKIEDFKEFKKKRQYKYN